MRTAIGIFLDLCEEGHSAQALAMVDSLQPWQVDASWEWFAPHCPDLLTPPLERREGSHLNVEIGQPSKRCRQQTPAQWGDADPRGVRWLLSGGSPLEFGTCCPASCPRARKAGAR
jgi:hypothetical protein